jgi:hypothetical protein
VFHMKPVIPLKRARKARVCLEHLLAYHLDVHSVGLRLSNRGYSLVLRLRNPIEFATSFQGIPLHHEIIPEKIISLMKNRTLDQE